MIFNWCIYKPHNIGTGSLQPADMIVILVIKDYISKMDEIGIVVRMVTSKTLEKYVSSPRIYNSLCDMLIVLKKFKNVKRRKQLFLKEGNSNKGDE